MIDLYYQPMPNGKKVAIFKRWFDEVGARPGVQPGLAAGADFAVDNRTLPPAEPERIRKIFYNQRAIPVAN
ncbi:thioredoxin domain-containing protein [Rhizobium terrae]|uniref:hypothetical protein n=1 Tax=Rhizobium terrae TaxID=2171756 RepID=UPI00196830A8|nr:hypothetical protein [Rhizobium terrae]